MVSKELLTPILEDESLTRGLCDAEARILIEWLVERSEGYSDYSESDAGVRIQAICRRARAIARFVSLWCYHFDHGAACQLAATERFAWPFPEPNADPCDIMVDALGWEGHRQDSPNP